MALRCIVVEAAEVFQGCLVAELVLVLQEGPDGGSISASPDTSQGSRAPRGHAPQPVARTSDSTPRLSLPAANDNRSAAASGLNL